MSDSIREKILGSKNQRFEMFTSKEWGTTVKVRGISYAQRTQLLKDCAIDDERVDMIKAVPRAIIETFVDPLTDKPIFQPADADTIAGQSPEAIEEARQVVWRVIGLSGEAIEKNSNQSEMSAASSDSPNV